MPKISKAAKEKKVVSKTKKTPIKTKKAALKKPVKKKVIKKARPKEANKITVDIISDEDIFNDSANLTNDIFSSWPSFEDQKKETDSEYKDVEEVENDGLVDNNLPTTDSYDKQRNFFSDWSAQNEHEEEIEDPRPKRSIGLYRRQAFFYLGATAVLLLAVLYLFFAKLTITIIPEGETVNDSITLNISTASSSIDSSSLSNSRNIDGDIQILEIEAEKTYPVSGEEVAGEEVFGEVKIINNYSKAQTLVATTRLLTPDGKLFRLKDRVSIPAGGTTKATVYADKPVAGLIVDSGTRFTIPGLWAGLQDKIYAENDEDLTLQTQVKRIVKQSDIDQAKKDINEVINLKLKNELKSLNTDKAAVYDETASDLTLETDVKLAEERSEFLIKAKKKVTVIFFSKEKAASLAAARLSLLVSDDKQLVGFDKEKIAYSLEDYNKNNNVADVKASFSGTMSLKSDATIIDPKKITGLSEQQVAEYLNSFPEIKEFKLKFWPSFIKNAPILPDKIEIDFK